ncbi:hypothetical protein H0H93_010803 [Arthromyces matolae]|nr:hypothetical protein H0H93_010803 [Arthromyces matolae]
MRIRSLVILASVFAILCSAIPILSNANSSTENNHLSNGLVANNELPKMKRGPQETPKIILTTEEKAARLVQIQKWEVELQRKNKANWERYQGGIKRAGETAHNMGKDRDDAEFDYRWKKMQLSLRTYHQTEGEKKKPDPSQHSQRSGRGPGRPRRKIDPADIADWEAKMTQRGLAKHLNALKKAEVRAIEDGKRPEEVEKAVARQREFAFLRSRYRVLREAKLNKKTDINHSESVAVQPEPAGHLQNEDDHALPERMGEMPMSFDFQLDSSDEEDTR